MGEQQRRLSHVRAGGATVFRFVFCQPASPWPPVCVYVPVIVASVLWNVIDGTTPGWMFVALPATGYLFWTLLEYLLHSEIFHRAGLPGVLRTVAEGHLSHHDEPPNPGLIVARLSFSVPVAAVLFGVFSLALWSARLAALLASGVIVGYLSYEIVHFAIHRSPRMRRLVKPLASHHLHHHYADASRCFGVSVPLWDWVFRTGRRTRQAATEGGDRHEWPDHPLAQ
jgi:sterol desaturase/sphingolipid hydroxylase (fatty acid hydroxylase superfamily)